MNTEVECPVIRDARRAETLGNVLKRGAKILRGAHREFSCDPGVQRLVEGALKSDLDEYAARFRKGLDPADQEQFHVELSEHRLAIKQAMAYLFPPAEEG